MSFLADSELAALQRHAFSWDIRSGEAYLNSSAMGLNARPSQGASSRPHDTSGLFLYQQLDTSHDLLDFKQFCDFMDSRAKQAEALVEDLNAYRDIATQYPAFAYTTQAGEELVNNFGERFVMAMYGIDENMHKPRLQAHLFECGERPYKFTCGNVSRAIGHTEYGDTASIDAICGELKAFAEDWNELSQHEAFYREYPDSDAPIKIAFGSREAEIQTSEMALRFAAEISGRAGYLHRTMTFSEELMHSPIGDMTVRNVDGQLRNQLAAISVLSKNEYQHLGGHNSYMPAYALDGVSFVHLAKKYAYDMSEQDVKPVQNGRDMADMDAAYSDVVGSGLSDGPDVGGCDNSFPF